MASHALTHKISDKLYFLKQLFSNMFYEISPVLVTRASWVTIFETYVKGFCKSVQKRCREGEKKKIDTG